jgi:hypothetical protein
MKTGPIVKQARKNGEAAADGSRGSRMGRGITSKITMTSKRMVSPLPVPVPVPVHGHAYDSEETDRTPARRRNPPRHPVRPDHPVRNRNQQHPPPVRIRVPVHGVRGFREPSRPSIRSLTAFEMTAPKTEGAPSNPTRHPVNPDHPVRNRNQQRPPPVRVHVPVHGVLGIS